MGQETFERDDIIWGLGSLPAYAKRARAHLRHFVLMFLCFKGKVTRTPAKSKGKIKPWG